MRYLLAIFLLTFAINSDAQYSYTPFPTQGAVWTYDRRGRDQIKSVITISHFLFKGDDTIINGLKYAKLYKRWSGLTSFHHEPLTNFGFEYIPREAPYQDGYEAFVREANKKVYIKWPFRDPAYNNWADTNEKILYDFNLKVGDSGLLNFRYSLNEIGSDYSFTHYLVRKIDTQFIANKNRKVFSVSMMDSLGAIIDPNITYTIIEGIGTTEGILTYGNKMYGGAYNFVCHEANGDKYPDNPDTNTCFFIYEYATLSVPSVNAENKINIYPNPTTDQVTIESPVGTNIIVYNSTGKVVATRTNKTPKERIELQGLPSGLYIINLHNDKAGLDERKKLMKL